MTRETTTQTQQQTPTTSLLSRGSILQRKCESCGQHTIAGGECGECAKKKSGLQRKLAIGASNDPLEWEADRVADQVMAASTSGAASDAPPRIQPFTGHLTEGLESAPPSIDHVLSSPGKPLEPSLQRDMGQRFGHNFSRVRVRTDAAAERSARDVNANAYTVGHNITYPKKTARAEKAEIQTKLTVGAPNDVYEQEADRVADQVMSIPDATQQPLQREAIPEEEEIQTKPLVTSITPLVQREAMPEEEKEVETKPSGSAAVQLEAMPEEEEIQTKPLNNSIQREAMPEEEEIQAKQLGNATLQREAMPEEEEEIQPKRSPDAGFQVGSNLESRLNSSQGAGSPLPDEVRTFMEPRFAADFSQVRVHTDNEAVQMNQDLNAQAFTHKHDVYFGSGKVPAKDTLTAHELTHVVQQTGRVQRQLQRRLAGTVSALPPQQQARTIEASTGSVSWINPATSAGSGLLGVPDVAPPATISESFITGSSGFRFSNYLHGYLTTNDSVTIASAGLYSNSGIYTSTSQFGLQSERFPTISSNTYITRGGIQGIQFNQLVGARTISGGAAGGAVGTTVGMGAGAYLGYKGAFIGSLAGLPGMIIGGIVGAGTGYFAGTAAGNTLPQTSFPPIWTEIQLTIMADGTRDFHMLRHSLFPSNSFYSNPVDANTLVRTNNYSALRSEETAWQNSGWGGGNPWLMNRPTFTP